MEIVDETAVFTVVNVVVATLDAVDADPVDVVVADSVNVVVLGRRVGIAIGLYQPPYI